MIYDIYIYILFYFFKKPNNFFTFAGSSFLFCTCNGSSFDGSDDFFLLNK